MEEHLAALVQGVLDALERHDTRYAALVERVVCSRCGQASAAGACTARDSGRCALYAYLPLVVETIRRGPSAA
jgi:hypothetical protein